MKIIDSITIKATIERVFDVFTDLQNATERVSGIEKIEVLEGSPRLQVGTKWRETRTMFGKEATEVMWVTNVLPNKSYVVEANSHGMKYVSTYEFEQTQDGVLVTLTFDCIPQTLGTRLMSPLFFLTKGGVKKALHLDLTDLKTAAERAV